MRSIWLASAAVIMTAGIAAAQTSPAPTGAPNAPTETPAGSMASPGNTGTGNNSATGSMGMNNSAASGSMAPTGAPQAAQESSNPNAAPGNMAPGGSAPTNTTAAAPAPATDSTSTTAMTTPAAKPMHHHAYAGGTLPENASADRYLHIASDAIKHHNKGVADDALSHAETRLLTRAVPASSDMTDDSPRISAIENARHALASGDFQTAADDTRQAMHGHMMGGMGNNMGQGSMGDMNSPTSTSDQPMPGSPMSNASASGTSAGNGK